MARARVPKGIDRELKRLAREAGALEGKPLSAVFDEALNNWLVSKGGVYSAEIWSDIEGEAAINNAAYEKLRKKLAQRTGRRYAVIVRGELVGIFNSLQEAAQASMSSGGKHGIVTEIGPRNPRVVRLG